MTAENRSSTRGELLKELRTKHAESVERTQALLKEQKKVQQKLLGALKDKPMTVPQLAAATELPADRVLWFVAALRKYGVLVENGMSGDYPLYEMAEAN
jgi:predicted Rossmann fold nucleotide-binding protein DprA/Smf involved in DNA uptake